MHNAKCTMHNFFLLLSILQCAFCISACSIPSLENSQCSAARDAVKRFYSFHFGNDMRPTQQGLRARSSFLTSELNDALSASSETASDYFTATDNYPKAFRVGLCNAEGENKATLQVVLLWRDDTSSDQKEVAVETVKSGDKWLIDKVSN